jgi:hypothetical protein
MSIEKENVQFAIEHSTVPVEALRAYAQDLYHLSLDTLDDESLLDVENLIDRAEESYIGAVYQRPFAEQQSYVGKAFNSYEDLAEELTEHVGVFDEIPERLQAYFDVNKWFRDLAFDLTFVECQKQDITFVFWSI